MKVSDIPDTQLEQVRQSLARAGNSNPSNDQILRTFWRGKMNNGG